MTPGMLGGRKGVLVIGILGAVLSLAFFASAVHAQTSTTTTASPSHACTGLGTPQEDGDCQGTGQFGDQTGPDTESASAAEVDG